MGNAGLARGDPVYQQVRSMMAACIEGDQSGFHPRVSPGTDGGLEFMHTVLQLIAEKPE